MEDELRNERGVYAFNPQDLDKLPAQRAMWRESPEDVKEAEEWGRELRRLLRWVRGAMDRRLTPRERAAIERCYFEGRSFREAGGAMGKHASTVHRAVRRALRKLRAAAEEDGVVLRRPRTGRRGQSR